MENRKLKKSFEVAIKEMQADYNVSREEMVTFLRANGWKNYKGKHVGSYFWTHKSMKGTGIGIENAYRIAKRREKEDQEIADIKSGTATIICNKCKKDMQVKFKSSEGKDIHAGYYGLVNAHISGGFESTALQDGASYNFSICEKCISDFFETFKIPPKVYIYL